MASNTHGSTSGARALGDDPMQRISTRLADTNRASMISNGDHAMLRRRLLNNKATTIGVTVKLLLSAGIDQSQIEEEWQAWTVVVYIAALISGTSREKSYNPYRGYGTALREAEPSKDSSDTKLLRLTVARGSALKDQIMRSGQYLAHVNEKAPFDLWNIFDLMSNSAEKSEIARRKIAIDYYGARP